MNIKEVLSVEFNSYNLTIDIASMSGKFFQVFLKGMHTCIFDKNCDHIPYEVNSAGWPCDYDFTISENQLVITRGAIDGRDHVVVVNSDNDNVKDSPQLSEGIYDIRQGVTALTLSGSNGSSTVQVETGNMRSGEIEFTTEDTLNVGDNVVITHVTGTTNFDALISARVEGQSIWCEYIVQGYV